MGEGPQHPRGTQWDPNVPSGTLVAVPPTGELGPQALMLGAVGPRSVELVPDPGEEVYEMTSVVLHCRVSAQPLPDVFEWFRDGRTLGRASKDRWVLSAVGIQESGRYRCRATNSITSADSPDVTITVYCKGYGHPWDVLLAWVAGKDTSVFIFPLPLPCRHQGHHPAEDLPGPWCGAGQPPAAGCPWVLPPPPVRLSTRVSKRHCCSLATWVLLGPPGATVSTLGDPATQVSLQVAAADGS